MPPPSAAWSQTISRPHSPPSPGPTCPHLQASLPSLLHLLSAGAERLYAHELDRLSLLLRPDASTATGLERRGLPVTSISSVLGLWSEDSKVPPPPRSLKRLPTSPSPRRPPISIHPSPTHTQTAHTHTAHTPTAHTAHTAHAAYTTPPTPTLQASLPVALLLPALRAAMIDVQSQPAPAGGHPSILACGVCEERSVRSVL